jgi:nitrite reductase (NO-forming)
MNTSRRPWFWILTLAIFPLRLHAAETVLPAVLTYAPDVPPPITRKAPAVVRVDLETLEKEGVLMKGLGPDTKYVFWTFNGHVPGPFIRVRVGDTLEVHLKNPASSTMSHNVDFHAVTGPGGGAALTLASPGTEKIARFKMLSPGLYVYHCAAPPVTTHIAMGMYGLILVEPEKGLSKVDREFYVLQSEFYTKGEFGDEGMQTYDIEKALNEKPTYIVFNGSVGALKDAGTLKVRTGEQVRIFFGNAGPNLVSSFHVIGEIFDRVYREGSLESPLAHVQTTLVPAGAASVVEFQAQVPGNYTLVDHSIFRIEKGALGILHVDGADRPDLYQKIQ